MEKAAAISLSRAWLERTRITLSRAFVGILGFGVVFGGSAWPASHWVRVAAETAGVALAVVAGLGRIWCSLYISGHKNRRLVTDGPYSLTRNPLYFFSLVGAVGVALCTCTVTVPACVAVAFALYYPVVIGAEERKLRDLHGGAFTEWCRVTPAFVPALRCPREPEFYSFCPRLHYRAWRDAAWFALVPPMVIAVQAAHQAGWLPTFVRFW